MKNLSRLTALLLALVMLLSITASATEISDYTKADYDANVLAAQSQTETEPSAPLTATDSGFNFAVEGEVPETAELYVTYMGADTTANIRENILSLPELEEGMSEYAFDITIVNDNAEWQPGTPVEVTITGVDTTADSYVQVYHIPDSQPAVATLSLMDEETTPAMTFEEVEAVAGDGTVTFMADGFSVYYVVSGTSNTGETLGNNEEHTVYMVAGTKATLSFPNNTSNRNIADSNTSDAITASVSNRTITISAGNNAQVDDTSTFTATWTESSRSRSATVHVIIISEEEADKMEYLEKFTDQVYVAVRRDGVLPGEPSVQGTSGYTFYNSSYNSGNNTSFANSAEGVIDQKILDHELFFYESVDGSDNIGLVNPTGEVIEAMVSGVTWGSLLKAVLNKGDTVPVGENSTVQSSNSTIYHENKADIDGDGTWDYKIVPYVVKWEDHGSYGAWHIDCALVPYGVVTLSYDINIPAGYQVETNGVGVPNSETGKPVAKFTVGKVAGLTTVEGESNAIKVVSRTDSSEEYVFMFQGWNTKADGSGSWYYPDGEISIEEDTVLYAIWNSNPAIGTGNLKVEKLISLLNGATLDLDQEFTFTFGIKNADGSNATGSYKYTIYGADNYAISGGTGTVANGGTINLKHGQYAVINDLPAPNAEDAGANITITESTVTGYTPTWEGGVAGDATTTVKIEGGRRSEITCTNIRAPQTAPLTISKTVTNANDAFPDTANPDFTFEVSLPAGTYKYSVDGGADLDLVIGDSGKGTITLKAGQSATIKDITIGTAYTVTETSLPAGYSIEDDELKGEIVAGGSEVEFANTYTTGSLTITKTGMAADETESAIFTATIAGKTYTVVLNAQNDWSETIVGLKYGSTYSVSEKNDWTWRYTQVGSSGISGTISGSHTATFNNKETDKWLYDESAVENKFATK